MKKNTVVIFEDQKIKIPFDIIVDPKKANELETVTIGPQVRNVKYLSLL